MYDMALDPILIGQRIKDRRDELGMSLGDLGEMVGVAASTIMRYEKGVIGKIKMPIISSIASALRVDPSWITGVVDEKGTYNKSESLSLSNEALAMAEKYEAAPPVIKRVVTAVLDIRAEG